MYQYNVIVKKSDIEGKGVFTLENIKKGSIVWKFNSNHDLSMSQVNFKNLDLKKKKEVEKIGYLSLMSKKWILPPKNDPALFTNHSSSENNLSVKWDLKISPEPFFISNKDILEGKEIIVNYLEFDEFIKKTKPRWV